jgi:hypothetical protein
MCDTKYIKSNNPNGAPNNQAMIYIQPPFPLNLKRSKKIPLA